MNLAPRISVIVPNYNHAQFLDERLESIFNQTFQDFEVILLDDASTDNSVEVLKKYSTNSKVVHFEINKMNSGSPFKQWEKGISLAKGELIWIAESDDYCKNNFLEKLLNVFDHNIVLAYSASNNINEESKILGRNIWAEDLNKSRWRSDYLNTGQNEISNYLRYRNTIPNASSVLFRKRSLKNIVFPVEMKYCGDWYLWIKILNTGKVAFISQPLNYFRRHKATTRQNSILEDEIRRFEEYLLIVKSNNSFFHRIRCISKFDWILKEKCRKKDVFGRYKNKRMELPIDLFLRYFYLCKFSQ